MKRHLRNSAVILALVISLGAAPATKSSSTEFLRFVPDKDGGTLQTSITHFKNNAGQTVDLVAAVHVGDPKYYAMLENRFKGYDALLYEMVKPEGMVPPPKGTKTGGTVTGIQRFLKNVLALDYQLDAIDYSAANFVHADLSMEDFERMEGERGESIWGMMLQSMLREMSKEDGSGLQGDVQLGQLLMALQSPDRPRQLKLLLAQQFNDIEDSLAGLDGPDGSVIVTERNKKALSVLDDQLKAGKKHLGIFYGAAHLPDMTQRLHARGFHETGRQWVVAWNMKAATTRPTTQNTVKKVETRS